MLSPTPRCDMYVESPCLLCHFKSCGGKHLARSNIWNLPFLCDSDLELAKWLLGSRIHMTILNIVICILDPSNHFASSKSESHKNGKFQIFDLARCCDIANHGIEEGPLDVWLPAV
jgi:hypothetical protein